MDGNASCIGKYFAHNVKTLRLSFFLEIVAWDSYDFHVVYIVS